MGQGLEFEFDENIEVNGIDNLKCVYNIIKKDKDTLSMLHHTFNVFESLKQVPKMCPKYIIVLINIFIKKIMIMITMIKTVYSLIDVMTHDVLSLI